MAAIFIPSDDLFEIVKKELHNTATAEEEHILWQDRNLSTWMSMLRDMESNGKDALRKWEEEYREKEGVYQRARTIKLPEWQLFCEKHDKRVKDTQKMLQLVRNRKQRLHSYFNEHKENNLYDLLETGTPTEVQEALDKLQETQSKIALYQQQQLEYAVLWGSALVFGHLKAVSYCQELIHLGFSIDQAAAIIREYVNFQLKAWVPHSRGPNHQEIPDFKQFLFERGYHTGPVQ
jgi:hypothetical protein